ncbi:aminodeoxychorismate/anthranilate synthase component II [Frankia sp. AgB1.9]|uniref:anthranilate synthase component II n=1 Tax=unclassified Frankia TaxID=2632575 RepID=UPI00193340CB|nr:MULTISPECIES: aminodeoxychorismate/anthranilate synthase component II [unclassified Frankia]MBL7493134.1 aminodeoxychorismate/anthranilate synthase component II [Frankia sp. AgW1.1]MBL7553697.1 aminodeoxychorismate/anthranilate synthase component II [Frankia sp. AgB1.9]MBL7621552.1 aminodeoxychorismate/anthranilate synthase component II [Frankia sp. AgB1.8]
MRSVIVDAYDSFSHIIYQYLMELGANPVVIRSGKATPAAIRAVEPRFLLLGPGPGHPRDSGHVELVREFEGELPILGICLGHQAIGMAYGGTVSPARHLMHGKTSRIVHDGRGVMSCYSEPFRATRYHSLVVEEPSVPDVLEVTARSEDDGYIMGLRHRSQPIESVQFHPESIMTEQGLDMLRSFMATYGL